MKPVALLLVLCLAWAAHPFEIVIDRGTDKLTPIGVVPFHTKEGASDISPIVQADLSRSGQFIAVDPEHMLSIPTSPSEVIFRDWRTQGVEYVVVGEVSKDSEQRFAVRLHVVDINQEAVIASKLILGPDNAFRDIAHRASDEAYEAITGVRGAFGTKLMYVLEQRVGVDSSVHKLQISDIDGERVRTLLTSDEPILSPAWSPDGNRVAYVSFATGRSAVYIHDLLTGEQRLVAQFEGTNSAPSFSPDGERLALALSRDGDISGNPEIYTLEIATSVLRRITSHRAIDTEPVWRADGERLLFTSDRGGLPQIYEVSLRSLLPKRVTFEGDYNARPQLLPDDEHLVYVHRDSGRYHIAWKRLADRRSPRILTSTLLDESPSIAPNGTMLVYATKERRQGILSMVSVDGDVKFKLPSAKGDVREPAWSPFLVLSNVSSLDL